MTYSFQAFPVDADGETGMDTHNTTVIPIVVVPGVMGTRLKLQGGGAPMWDPDAAAQMLLWTRRTAREKSKFLNPVLTRGDIMTVFSGGAREAVVSSKLAGIAAREEPSVVPKSKTTGRDSDIGPARQRLVEYYAIRRGWAGVAWAFYGPLLLRLETLLNEGSSGTLRYPVYASGYDWRKSNLDSGARLSAEIQAILARHPLAEQVLVVSHSMGGLVTRVALSQSEPKIRGVIHCVLPADGAAVAYRRFQTGATAPFDTPQSPFPAALEAVGAKVLNAIMGSDRVSYAMVQSGLRGPVELLPSNNYASVFLETTHGTNLTQGDVYNTYALEGPPGIVPKPGSLTNGSVPLPFTPSDAAELRARIAGARALHTKLGSKFHPNTFAIYGDALRTDTHFNWNLGLVNELGDEDDLELKVTQFAVDHDPDRPGVMVTGDGTVPAISARLTALPKDRRVRVNGAEHAGCFAKAEFMEQLESCLISML